MDWVYASVLGSMRKEYAFKEVENLFEEGKQCMDLYGDMIEAAWRVCDRLGVDEDEDVEIMINSMLDMMKIVSCRMYAYGAEFGMLE